MTRRTDLQREAWRNLDPWRRRLLTSHRPDDVEQEAALCHSVMTALENVYGPREWTPAAARVEEGDGDGDGDEARGGDFAMTYGEIGEAFGISRERVRGIINTALQKLLHNAALSGLHEIMYGERAPVVAQLDRAMANAANAASREVAQATERDIARAQAAAAVPCAVPCVGLAANAMVLQRGR